MSADDKALRNATGLSMDGLMSRCQGWQGATHIQRSPEVMRFSLGDKRIAMERVRTC